MPVFAGSNGNDDLRLSVVQANVHHGRASDRVLWSQEVVARIPCAYYSLLLLIRTPCRCKISYKSGKKLQRTKVTVYKATESKTIFIRQTIALRSLLAYTVILPRWYCPWAVCFYCAMLSIRGTSHEPVSVCLSVTSRCSTKTAERIELVFGMWASFHPSYTVLKGNSGVSKYKGTSLSNFVLNTGLRKFRHGISTVETCYQLSSRKVDAHSVINWAVVGQLSR